MEEFLSTLDLNISRSTKAWMETGYQMAIANANAFFGYGAEDHRIMIVVLPQKGDGDLDVSMAGTSQKQIQSPELEGSVSVIVKTSEVVYRRFGDPNIYPYLHASLAFLHFLSSFPAAMYHLEGHYPWKLLALMLNTLLVSYSDYSRIEGEEFPRGDSNRPLPDDYALRGLLWTKEYFPNDWFTSRVDDDERYFEVPSMTEERKERILWLACRLSKSGRVLTYRNHQFGVTKEYDVEIGPAPQGGDAVMLESNALETFTSQPFLNEENEDDFMTAPVA